MNKMSTWRGCKIEHVSETEGKTLNEGIHFEQLFRQGKLHHFAFGFYLTEKQYILLIHVWESLFTASYLCSTQSTDLL